MSKGGGEFCVSKTVEVIQHLSAEKLGNALYFSTDLIVLFK